MAQGPVEDIGLEESILSTMMGDGVDPGARIHSLTRDDFTCPFRARLYELLREGRPYADLEVVMRVEGWQDGALVGITDLFLTGGLPKREITPAVADLKRLTHVRNLCEAVDKWREKAPHLSHELALKTLGQVIRQQGKEASIRLLQDGKGDPAQKSSVSPSPR